MPSVKATLESLATIARQIIVEFPKRPKNEGLVMALVGELGAGKTTFTQVLGEELGISRSDIRSPSFVLQKIYTLSQPAVPFKHFVHIDCYRLDSVHELHHLKWTELLAAPGNLIVVEWADKIESQLPSKYLKIELIVVSDTERLITWQWST